MNREGEVRIPSGCAISGVFAKDGTPINGDKIVKSMTVMHERSNGLGGGFAGYGIYPQYADLYAFHLFYNDAAAREECETYIDKMFEVVNLSRIPIRKSKKITDVPLIWRYFVTPNHNRLADSGIDEREYVARAVININTNFKGSYVFSSGKNMGVFKAVGFPEDVGEFYRLDEYEGYCWTGHGRYPTNTPGWWGGAHPFAMLDYSVVHNGEISSSDANRRYIEMFGYKCTLLTDTEVITYMTDYLMRRLGLSPKEVANVFSASFWTTISRMPEAERDRCTRLRKAFSSLLITGPFSILLGYEGGLMALNDRLKLRSMVAAEKGKIAYVASEECAIRQMEPDAENLFSPAGGEPIIYTLEKKPAKAKG